MHGSLSMNWKSILVLFFLFLISCETESEAATHDLSWAVVLLSPDIALAHFWKNDGQKMQNEWVPSVSWTKEWTYSRLIHIHSSVTLHQAVAETPVRSIIFPTLRVISQQFSTHLWQSGHLWDTVLYFNGCILNPCWITMVALKNVIRKIPITFALVQLLLQKYFISEFQCFY